jgi:hypothetical protein
MVQGPYHGPGPIPWPRAHTLVQGPYPGPGPISWSRAHTLVQGPYPGPGPIPWSRAHTLVQGPCGPYPGPGPKSAPSRRRVYGCASCVKRLSAPVRALFRVDKRTLFAAPCRRRTARHCGQAASLGGILSRAWADDTLCCACHCSRTRTRAAGIPAAAQRAEPSAAVPRTRIRLDAAPPAAFTLTPRSRHTARRAVDFSASDVSEAWPQTVTVDAVSHAAQVFKDESRRDPPGSVEWS